MAMRLGEAEAKVIRLSAATAAHRAASREEAEALIERVDWHALERELERRRLLGLLGERIEDIAGPRAPEPFRLATDAAISSGCAQDAWLELISMQVTHALAEAGIPSLPLKGPFLGRAIYGVPGRRSSGDVDLLVVQEHLVSAAQVIEGLGYQQCDSNASRGELPRLHLRFGAAGLPVIELHWRVHWYESQFSREMLGRSYTVRGSLRRAAPLDELTSLLLFYARDGFVDLRLASDLAAWWDTCGLRLTDGTLEEQIERYPELERALLAATQVAEQVGKLPGEILLRRRVRPEARVRAAISLKNPDLRGSDQQQQAEKHLVDWLLAPDGGHRQAIRRGVDDARRPNAIPPELRRRRTSAVLHAVGLISRFAFASLRVAARRPQNPADVPLHSRAARPPAP